MKVAIPVLLAVAILAFGGLYFWQAQQIAGAQAESDAMQETADARAVVPVTFVVKPPADTTPQKQTIYISGSHPALGSWEAAGLPLERQDDGSYRATCEMLSGIEQTFKVTRGSWSTVERTADDQDVPNRAFIVEPDKELVVEVEAWVDHGQTEPGRNTAGYNVVLHERRFFSTVDDTKPRSVVVYLPKGYDGSAMAEQRFPVLYVNDGQNLFNEATSFAGVEWGLDEDADSLIAERKIPHLIIVGLYNTEDRDTEYAAGVEAYAKHVKDTIMPWVAETYRVSEARGDTAIAGAALGGRAALEVARLNPDTFGAVIALSPWVVDRSGDDLAQDWAGAGDGLAAWAERTRFYLDTVDSTDYYPTQTPVEDLEQIVSRLEAADADVTSRVVEGGEHREASWGRRAAAALVWAFGGSEDAGDATARVH